jgi:diacylglycerol kinase family enzyme
MEKIGIIHNPFAKGNLKRPWIAKELEKVVGDVGVFRETRNIEELPMVAEEFLEQGIETIAVNGGDGSLHLVLTAFVPVYGDKPLPKLMTLRGGTMNTMSNSLKIKGKTLGILKKAVEKIKAGEPFNEREQYLIKVSGKYGFMSGTGYISNFLDAYYSGSSTGPWQAIKLISRAVGSVTLRTDFINELFQKAPLKVTVDGKQLDPEEFSIVLACSVRELGLGFKPTPRAYDKPGHFHLIAATIRPGQVVPKLPGIWLGKDLIHPEVQHSNPAKEVVVEPKGALRWTLDGEMYETEQPLRFSVGPTITVVEP